MIFKKSLKQPAAAQPADSPLSLSSWARQLYNRALAAKKDGRPDEALELLGQLTGRLQTAAHARSPQLLQILAKANVMRATVLDEAGGRQGEAIAAADSALATLDALDAGTLDVQNQTALMLLLRIRVAESTSMGGPELTRLLENSIERIRRLPTDTRRSLAWLVWNRQLMSSHLDQGRTAEAVRMTRQVIEGLPAIGTAPALGFSAIHAGMHLAVTVAPGLVEAGEVDLAAELAERCVSLVGDASAADFGEANSLKIAKGSFLAGIKLSDATATRIKLFAVAVAQFRAANASESRDAKVRHVSAGALNAYAWALACRNGLGDNEAALPIALEAVEQAQGLVADSSRDMDARAELAASLDTLATVQAQLGDTAAALESAREAQAVARDLAETEQTKSGSSLVRVTQLVELIEQGAVAGLADRA